MRILYHHRTLADGAEGVHIAEMIAAFRGLGHEVQVRGLAEGGEKAGRRVAQWVKRELPAAAFEAASVVSNAVDYADVRRAIRRTRPDFLYVRHARHSIGALEAAHHAGVPAVLEVNCLFAGPSYLQFEPMVLTWIASRIERRALGLAQVVLAVSSPLARAITDASTVEPVVLPNGADPERFDPACADPARVRARFGLGHGLIVGWSGVMRDWHGLDLLLDALASVPDVRLLLVGDGPARNAIERRAAALGLRARLVLTGRVSHAEMPDYLAAMDVAVVASDRTGVASPMKLLEYMSMERAVVAPRLENVRDLITEARDGLLFTPGDAADLARAIRLVASDAEMRGRLGAQARRTVLNVRNWRRNAEQVLALVAQHIGSTASEGVPSGG
jgi:glycosyltransferase involved in cell wall biosynthesis